LKLQCIQLFGAAHGIVTARLLLFGRAHWSSNPMDSGVIEKAEIRPLHVGLLIGSGVVASAQIGKAITRHRRSSYRRRDRSGGRVRNPDRDALPQHGRGAGSLTRDIGLMTRVRDLPIVACCCSQAASVALTAAQTKAAA
jgi:hypothetical protein